MFADKRGLETIEYAIIGALIIVVAIVGLRALGVNIGQLFQSLASTVGGTSP